MSWDEEDDKTIYKVVVNHEEQYSIWPADRALPLGWDGVGKQGTKQECLDYIEEVTHVLQNRMRVWGLCIGYSYVRPHRLTIVEEPYEKPSGDKRAHIRRSGYVKLSPRNQLTGVA